MDDDHWCFLLVLCWRGTFRKSIQTIDVQNVRMYEHVCVCMCVLFKSDVCWKHVWICIERIRKWKRKNLCFFFSLRYYHACVKWENWQTVCVCFFFSTGETRHRNERQRKKNVRRNHWINGHLTIMKMHIIFSFFLLLLRFFHILFIHTGQTIEQRFFVKWNSICRMSHCWGPKWRIYIRGFFDRLVSIYFS